MTVSNQHTDYHQARLDYAESLFDSDAQLPYRYVFILTNRCNLACTFCFQEKSAIEGSLDLDGWLRVVNQLPDYAHVTLTGGEPLMFRGFNEILDAVTERFTCNIISNGLLLTEPLIDHMLERERLKVLSLSIDDIGNIARDVRPKQWQKMVDMCNYLVARRTDLDKHLILDTKTVVLDENVSDLAEIHRFCIEELKADTHSFMLLKGHSIQHADVMAPPEDMFRPESAHLYPDLQVLAEQLEEVRRFNASSGSRGFLHPEYVDLNGSEEITAEQLWRVNLPDHNPEFFQGCKAPWESVHINVDGAAMPCMAIQMGNIQKESIQDVFFGGPYSEFRQVIRAKGTVEGCNRCGYLRPSSH